ncbi:MAG: DNA-binding protein [Treponema sp.]|nr:DNA-binding protein [Treponema sp.]
MEYRQFGDTFVVRLNRGEEIITELTALCKKENIELASVQGIGAADLATIGLYNVSEKFYHKTQLKGAMEISSLLGNITTMNGETYLHLHINLCDENMNIRGGHLNECRISATGEIIVTKINGNVDRIKDNETGLNIFKF